MREYRTRDGDTLGELTWRLLSRDDDEIEQELHRLNPHLIKYPQVFPAGVVIKIPPPKAPQPVERTGVWS